MSNGWYATYNDFGATWGKAVGAAGIAIYQSLASRAWDGQCFPSYQTIADDTGVSRPTAIKYIKKLQNAGLIEVQPRVNRRGDPTSNLYTLTNLPMLKKKSEAPAEPKFEEIDTSGLSEDEIAELKRKSLFLSRSKKKSRKSASTTPKATPPVEVKQVEQQVEKVEVAEAAQISEPPSPPPQVVIQQETPVPQSPEVQQTSESNVPVATAAKVVKEERIVLGEFGKTSPQKDIINAYHMLKGIPNKQELIDELNKAIRENRIQTTPIQYLHGLIKKWERGEFVPTAHKKTEDELFREEQQRADEKERARKKAIAECHRCTSVGHLVYSSIQSFQPKVKICTHDAKADEFIAARKAEEARGETICYFGKGTPLDEKTAQEVANVIRGTVATMTGKPLSDIELTPEPVETEQKMATPPVEEQPTPSGQETVQEVEPEAKRGGGLRRIGDVTSSVAVKMVAARTDSESSDQPPSASDQPSEVKPQVVVPTVDETINEFTRALNIKLENVSPEPMELPDLPPGSLDDFSKQYDQDRIFDLVKEGKSLPESTGKRLLKNGEPMSAIAERIAIVKDELDRLYTFEETITQAEILGHVKLQCAIRSARLRALVHKDAQNENSCHSERLRTEASRTANIVQMAAPVMFTVTQTLKFREMVDFLLEVFEAPPGSRFEDPPSDVLAQRLLDNLQELQIVRKYLAIEVEKKSKKQANAVTPNQIERYHKEMRHEKQYQLMCLIQDRDLSMRDNLVAANNLIQAEWKCTPEELGWIELRLDGTRSF